MRGWSLDAPSMQLLINKGIKNKQSRKKGFFIDLYNWVNPYAIDKIGLISVARIISYPKMQLIKPFTVCSFHLR